MSEPCISIITVNLNDASGLQKTVDSVLSQKNTNYEFIVIDGGSNDSSVEIIKNNDSKISYWISEPDSGIYNAMNKGIKQAKGKYCFFLNSGDRFYNNETLNHLQRETLSADIVNCAAIVIDRGGKEIYVPGKKTVSFYDFYVHSILHQATLIHRELFNTVSYYNEHIKFIADWEFFIKALFIHNCSYQYIPITLSYFDGNGVSSKKENAAICKADREKVLREHFPLFINDYKLIASNPIYKYLVILDKNKILKKIAEFRFRVLNKVFGSSLKNE